MARRMVSQSIFTSLKWAKISDSARILWLGLLVNSDDAGDMDRTPIAVKGKCFPMDDKTVAEVEKFLKELIDVGLIIPYESGKELYLHISQFSEHQTLRADRASFAFPLYKCERTCCKIPLWLDNQSATKWQPSGNQRATKKPLLENTIGYLSAIPLKDMAVLLARFIATEGEIRSKAESLKLYCESKGRKYKNYKSFLLNALKRDFKERAEASGKYRGL